MISIDLCRKVECMITSWIWLDLPPFPWRRADKRVAKNRCHIGYDGERADTSHNPFLSIDSGAELDVHHEKHAFEGPEQSDVPVPVDNSATM